ncbi:hypothetical protein VP1G_10631 [Cytospora mali]|uniref:Uncharacterized protein n=1 Tax=Cytospora mali TaxID=578113 RepID=A0A194UT31_CYTMA|nr:hypothetical protein VP1G_10631 [Valsa mali var. pyri (nom. inval.)]
MPEKSVKAIPKSRSNWSFLTHVNWSGVETLEDMAEGSRARFALRKVKKAVEMVRLVDLDEVRRAELEGKM